MVTGHELQGRHPGIFNLRAGSAGKDERQMGSFKQEDPGKLEEMSVIADDDAEDEVFVPEDRCAKIPGNEIVFFLVFP